MKGTNTGGRVVIRYSDLVEMGVVNNRTQVPRIIENEGFPEGFMLSANARAWFRDDVEAWLAKRASVPINEQRAADRAARQKRRSASQVAA